VQPETPTDQDTAEAHPRIARELGPRVGAEAAVLSCLSVRVEDGWQILAGSLLTVPAEAAEISWPKWRSRQPLTRGPRRRQDEPDLGARFAEEPFEGIQIARIPLAADEWEGQVGWIEAGQVELPEGAHRLETGGWSATKLLAQEGTGDAARVVRGARRPVRGVSAETAAPPLPTSQPHWVRGGSPKPLEEQTREDLSDKEIFTHWPGHLLGIDWLGGDEHAPPLAFVVGRAEGGTWIADVVPDYDNDQLRIVLAWEAEHVDPFSCSVSVRSERADAPLIARLIKVSDFPGERAIDEAGREARDIPWNERTLDVRLPRGGRSTAWGMSLFGPDGGLLDEREVGARVERLAASVSIDGGPAGAVRTIAGDPNPAPDEAEREREAAAARALEEAVRRAAAERRLATTDELEHYLRWRFSARAGELLIIDRYLFDGGQEAVERVIDFLSGLGRPIRAIVTKVDATAPALLAGAPQIDARVAPKGFFHDRLWIVGETGLSVGASVNQILREAAGGSIPATTAVDLPFADAEAWRSKFETWWTEGQAP